jgi:hypothetical protein
MRTAIMLARKSRASAAQPATAKCRRTTKTGGPGKDAALQAGSGRRASATIILNGGSRLDVRPSLGIAPLHMGRRSSASHQTLRRHPIARWCSGAACAIMVGTASLRTTRPSFARSRHRRKFVIFLQKAAANMAIVVIFCMRPKAAPRRPAVRPGGESIFGCPMPVSKARCTHGCGILC